MKPAVGCEGQNRQISGSPSDKRIPETIGNKLFNVITTKDMFSQVTVRIQFKVLTTLSLQFKGF